MMMIRCRELCAAALLFVPLAVTAPAFAAGAADMRFFVTSS